PPCFLLFPYTTLFRSIVASLPDGLWFTPWVRDMAYAVLALIRMGHLGEARAALAAYFNARPTGVMRRETADADYQISVVRYFGRSEEHTSELQSLRHL